MLCQAAPIERKAYSMRKLLLSTMLIFFCLCFSACDFLPGYKNQEAQTSDDIVTESKAQTEETTAEETEPAIGHTPYAPIPFGETVEVPASKGDLTMRVLEVMGHTGDIIIKMNLTVENLKPNTRIDLSGSDFELFCDNGRIVDADYGYQYEYDYLDIPHVYDVTIGGDGSIDFYVSFRGHTENGKMLIVSYANNKYLYFALT